MKKSNKKMKFNIQFFAEDYTPETNVNDEKPNESEVMTPEDVLNKLMGTLPIEEWADEFDVLQKTIASNGTNMTSTEDYNELKKQNEKLAKSYSKLTEAYKKRFGELTEEKVENTLGRNEESELDYRDLNMAAGFFAGTE